MIPVAECLERHVYHIKSRNLRLGAFRKSEKGDGFLGLRTKFNSIYIFEEYHRETGGMFGTVSPLEDTGLVIPDDILLAEYMSGSWDEKTGREVFFDKPVTKGGKGWCWKDTGMSDTNIRPYIKANEQLKEFLMQVEKDLGLR